MASNIIDTIHIFHKIDIIELFSDISITLSYSSYLSYIGQ